MIIFDVNTIVQGDMYLRCYHIKDDKQSLDSKKNRRFMFRVSFHTGFVPSSSVLRLTKTEIDDAIKSNKYDKDFFVDFLFEPVKEEGFKQASINTATSSAIMQHSENMYNLDDDIMTQNEYQQQQQQQQKSHHQNALVANEWI